MCHALESRSSPRGVEGGPRRVGRAHSQVLEGILAQVPREPVCDLRLEEAACGPPQHPAQDVHTLQGVQRLETPLQRDEEQAAIHARALQGLLPNLSQVDDNVFQLLEQ